MIVQSKLTGLKIIVALVLRRDSQQGAVTMIRAGLVYVATNWR